MTLLAFLVLIFYTSHKLYKMYAIKRAFETSAHSYKLTNKWINEVGKYTHYTITWASNLHNIRDWEQDNIEPQDWNKLKIGDEIQVVALFNSTFSKQSVYMEEGNFEFDFILLALEIIGLVLLIWKREWVYAGLSKLT